jgi:hypothetical protein
LFSPLCFSSCAMILYCSSVYDSCSSSSLPFDDWVIDGARRSGSSLDFLFTSQTCAQKKKNIARM